MRLKHKAKTRQPGNKGGISQRKNLAMKGQGRGQGGRRGYRMGDTGPSATTKGY